MTKANFKSSLQSELNADCISFRNPIEEIGESGANTWIKFKYPIDESTKNWLQNRFVNGIHFQNNFTNKDESVVFINTPVQNKVFHRNW